MSRGLSSDFLTQLSSQSLKPFYAIKAEFLEGDVRFWTGVGDVTIDSEVYTGGGSLMSIGVVEETAEIKAVGLTITINGLDADVLPIALATNYQNRKFTCFLGMLDESNQVIPSVYQLFEGRMDLMTINDSADDIAIALTVESRLIDLEKPNETRFTSEEQKRLFPNDKGLDFVTDLQDKDINWGGS